MLITPKHGKYDLHNEDTAFDITSFLKCSNISLLYVLPLACVYLVTQSSAAWIEVRYRVCLRILSVIPIEFLLSSFVSFVSHGAVFPLYIFFAVPHHQIPYWIIRRLSAFIVLIAHVRRSQWPRGLKRRSLVARLLRLWVRIPPGA